MRQCSTLLKRWMLRSELPAVREVHAAICSTETATDRSSEHVDILKALQDHKPSEARLAMKNRFNRLLNSMIDVAEEIALEDLRKKTTASRRRYLNGGSSDQTA